MITSVVAAKNTVSQKMYGFYWATLYMLPLTGKPEQQWFTIQSAKGHMHNTVVTATSKLKSSYNDVVS